ELAQKAGVVIPEPEERERRRPQAGATERDERALLLRVNELAARFFEAELKRSERAQQYLAERRVSAELLSGFRLGCAPGSWDGLVKVFAERRVPYELAELAG